MPREMGEREIIHEAAVKLARIRAASTAHSERERIICIN